MKMVAGNGLEAAEPVEFDWLAGEPESWMGLRSSKPKMRVAAPAARMHDRPGAFSRFSAMAAATLRSWRARRQFDELLRLDDRMLDDIGLSRGMLAARARR